MARDPLTIKNATLRELRNSLKLMLSEEAQAASKAMSQAEKNDYAIKMMNVNAAITDLENAELGSLRDKLKSNDSQLKAGSDAVSAARKNLETLANTLRAVGELLTAVGRVVTLLIP